MDRSKVTVVMFDEYQIFPANLFVTTKDQQVVAVRQIQDDLVKQIDYFKADSLDIISEQEIPWTFDGEYGGSWSSIHIENRKCSVQLILNRNRGNELPI